MTVFNPSITGKVTLTGTRFASGFHNSNGRYEEGINIPISFEANHQPVSGRELLLVPEAERVKDVRKIYTSFTLRTARVPNRTLADEVVIDNLLYQVFQVETYNMGVLNHTKAIVIRKDQ